MSSQWRNSAVEIPTEDKLRWCREGAEYELAFIRAMNQHSHLQIDLNPEKHTNDMAPDLTVAGYGLCDLKTQRTPFFTSSKYGIPPEYAITLNLKDVMRYRGFYPDLGIFFWIDWKNNTVENNRYDPIPYKWAVYFATMGQIVSLVDNNIAKSHEYKHRKQAPDRINKLGMNKQRNATASYVLDCRWLTPIISSRTDPWEHLRAI